MKLYVMRHGPAEDQADSGLDGDRALTPSGRHRVREVAQALVAEGEEPNTVFTSPLVRAVQTAEIVAITTKLTERGGSVEANRDLVAGADLFPFVTKLEAKRAMIVGHEPDLSELVARLIGAPMPVPMGKAMVVGLALHDGSARIRFVLDPKTLEYRREPHS
jgi:phosphohistidine phosphatase